MNGNTPAGRFVLITPARNEEANLGRTIASVAAQTVLPRRWVIVNDGSADRTREIGEAAARQYDFIRLINRERDGKRNFGSKALAFERGVSELGDCPYEFIGNLDADITLEPRYFQRLLPEFEADPRLGIAGGIVYTRTGDRFSTSDKTADSVGGAVQMFRRACFEAVGGYPPLEFGGIDAAVEIKARMLGWNVRKFPELRVYEHRRTGTAAAGPLTAKLREGRRFHSLGYGTLFYFMRCLYRIKNPPFILGSIAACCGYLDSLIRRRPVLLAPDVVAHWRREHRERLRDLFRERGKRLRQPAS